MKATALSIVIAFVLIGGAFMLAPGDPQTGNDVPADNVTIVDGKQIVDITAKGGYVPQKSTAQAGIPTVLRFNTSGTFDCSSAVRIPSMDISRNLPPSGATEIDLGNPEVGTLRGTCAMGMYPFEIEFQG